MIYINGQLRGGVDSSTTALIESFGFDTKTPARATTAVDLATDSGTTWTYDNGSNGVGATLTSDANGNYPVDGVSDLAVGDRVLIKDDGIWNGIYAVTQAGDGSNPMILTRSEDFDNSPEAEIAKDKYVLITEGDTHPGTGWVVNAEGPFTLGTDTIPFTLFVISLTGAQNAAIDAANSPGAGNPIATINDVSAATEVSVNQAGHGLAVRDVIYNNAGTWTKAQADSVDTLGVAIVVSVEGVNDFTYLSFGVMTSAGHGYTVGDYLFLSETTAGLLTETEPTGISEYSNPLAYVVDADTLLILPWRPSPALPRYNDLRVTKTTDLNYVAIDLDEVIVQDVALGNGEVLLPTGAEYDGFTVTVAKDFGGGANTVTVKAASGLINNVDATTGYVISGDGDAVVLTYDGTDYTIRSAFHLSHVTDTSNPHSTAIKQEFHTVTAGEVTAGYFTMTGTPVDALSVRVESLDGVAQLHKQTVGIGAETPDFDVLSTDQIHVNNNGAATGLSEAIIEGDKLLITYIGA